MIILGLLDLISAGVLIAVIKITVPLWLIIVCASYLIFKGLIFIKDIASILDIIVGVLLVISLFGFSLTLIPTIIISAFLVLKGLMTCFSAS
ncbi:MAG: hypothetical protein ABID67_00580 [Candidatus Nealsonbacteria bacterium]